MRLFVSATVLLAVTQRGGADCGSRGTFAPGALRVVVVIAGEEDPAVAKGVAALGANAIATLTPPRLETALAAASAGLGYIPRLSTSDVDRLQFDPARVDAIRAMPAIAGFQYLDEEVTEGYASPATQERSFETLKALFPGRFVIYATRIDLIATDPRFLAGFYRPEFTDFVTPYFYPVGTTVLGTQEETDPWEARLRSLLAPLAAATPPSEPILPVLQAFEQQGHPAGGGLPRRQLAVYREFWPENQNVAAFWWGGPTTEPFVGIADLPRLSRGIAELFGRAPSRPLPCTMPEDR